MNGFDEKAMRAHEAALAERITRMTGMPFWFPNELTETDTESAMLALLVDIAESARTICAACARDIWNIYSAGGRVRIDGGLPNTFAIDTPLAAIRAGRTVTDAGGSHGFSLAVTIVNGTARCVRHVAG